MRIVVLIKEVPDTYAERIINLETGVANRDSSEKVIDEIGEKALEAALSFADANPGTQVTVLTMGPASAANSLRRALSIGAADAIHLLSDEWAGADLALTSKVLAKALSRLRCDLVLCGNSSTDGNGGVIPAMIAERLGLPHATNLSELAITADGISGRRPLENGSMEIAAPLPAVVSVTEQLPEARFPSFKAIMGAKKKPLETWDLHDEMAGVAGGDAAQSIVLEVSERPARTAGIKIIDDGAAATQLAEFLTENRFV